MRISPSAARSSATSVRPQRLLVVAGLYKPEMKIEIEVTAKRRSRLIPAPLPVSTFPERPMKMSPASQIHAKISGPIVMIGFGSIGKGTLPLIERHFDYDKSRFVIIDPHEDGELAKKHGVRFIKQGVTRDNYRELLVPLLTEGGGQGFCVNLSVDTSSVDIMTHVPRDRRALYRHRDRAVARLLFRQEHRPREALQLRAARDAAGGQAQEPGRHHRGLHLRRQSRHGVLVRQAGAARHRPRHRHADSTSRRAAKAGASSRTSSASRASISPSATPSAPRSRSR